MSDAALTSGKKIVVVVGGTGMVGGSVARSLHDNPEWWVRITTRDPTTAKAKRRIEEGFEVVKADSWNSQELDAAFKGAYAVFLNTDSDDANFKNEVGPPESAMEKIVIDAAFRQQVKYFVFAGLPQANRLTNGEVSILSFDNKSAIANYGRKVGFEGFSEVNIGWAMEVFWMETYSKAFGGFATTPDPEGYLTVKIFPMSNDPERIPWTSVKDDYGDAVHAVLLDPRKYDKKIIWAVSECASFQHVADSYNAFTGSQVARFVAETEPLQAATPGKTKEVNGLQRYCHYMKGNYCNGQPTDDDLLQENRELKQVASKARGKSGSEAQLQTIAGFIRAYCPVQPAQKP